MSRLDLDLAGLERQLHQALQSAIQEELAAAGLQEVGHPMLLCILGGVGRHPETSLRTQRELAELLNVSPAAVTNSLKSLERKGYISRRTEAGDARCNQVCLTDKGRRAVQACMDCLEAVSRRMSAGLSCEELTAFRTLSQRMLDNLSAPPREGGRPSE